MIDQLDDQTKKEEALKRLNELCQNPSGIEAIDENLTEEEQEWIRRKIPNDSFGNLRGEERTHERKIIAKQRDKILSKQNSIDVYLECKECAAIPIWDTKTKDGNQNVFDHYQ